MGFQIAVTHLCLPDKGINLAICLLKTVKVTTLPMSSGEVFILTISIFLAISLWALTTT